MTTPTPMSTPGQEQLDQALVNAQCVVDAEARTGIHVTGADIARAALALAAQLAEAQAETAREQSEVRIQNAAARLHNKRAQIAEAAAASARETLIEARDTIIQLATEGRFVERTQQRHRRVVAQIDAALKSTPIPPSTESEVMSDARSRQGNNNATSLVSAVALVADAPEPDFDRMSQYAYAAWHSTMDDITRGAFLVRFGYRLGLTSPQQGKP